MCAQEMEKVVYMVWVNVKDFVHVFYGLQSNYTSRSIYSVGIQRCIH